MALNYLQSFLDARLFTIAEENSNYQFLTATVPLFEKEIAKNKTKIIAATLVALDQNIPPDDPILDKVEGLLKKEWPLIRNKFADRPTTLLRAIILEALYNLMQKNKVVANLIWLTGSNFFTFASISNETSILQKWLREAGELAENNARAEWGLTTNISAINIPEFVLDKITLPNVKIEKAGLQQGLNSAVMNGQQISLHIGSHVGHQAFSNVKQEWSTAFSTTAADSISAIISTAFNSLATSLNTMNVDKSINDFFAIFKDELVKTLAGSLKSTEKLGLRNQILWWKEALYSASAQKSYRDMETPQAALSMAIDLAAETPAVYPVSIDFILKETVLSCIGTDQKDKILAELLTQMTIASDDLVHFGDFPEHGRISFGAFLVGLASKKTTPTEMLSRTGISPESKVSYGQLTALLFHDIQALQINIK